MKNYKLNIGQLYSDKDVPIFIDIPENVKFFGDEHYVGMGLVENHKHYTTIVRQDKYPEWVEYLKNSIFGVNVELFGDVYMIVCIDNVSNETPLPIINRKEWFDKNNIDFSHMIICTEDSEGRLMNVIKLTDFKHLGSVDCIIVTRRDFFSNHAYFSITTNTGSYKTFYHRQNSHDKSYFMFGKQADMYWNTMLNTVISKVNYKPSLVNTNLDFDEKYHQLLKDMEKISELLDKYRLE